MDKDFSNVSLLIIAGGQSSRMQQDKRLISIGRIGLLESILIKAVNQNFVQIFLCVEESLPFIEQLALKYNAVIVTDKTKKAGPISGLAEGLRRITTEWALAVSCDMPFFKFEKVETLIKYLNDDLKVVLPSINGRQQPLAAFYHKSMAENFCQSIINNQRKLKIVIEKVPYKIVELSTDVFFNVNTPADLRLARGRIVNANRKTPIISIIAPSSGTGKTTFIERLIPRLSDLNIKVGVVKSDAHGFNLDVEGKDSFRFQRAGAQSVAVVSPNGWFMIQKTDSRIEFEQITNKMDNIDLILTESRTHGTCPAISLYRGIGEPLINEDVVTLFTSKTIESVNNVIQYNLDDIDAAVDVCVFLMA